MRQKDELEVAAASADRRHRQARKRPAHGNVAGRASLICAVLQTDDMARVGNAPGDELEGAVARPHRRHEDVAAGLAREVGDGNEGRGAGQVAAVILAGEAARGLEAPGDELESAVARTHRRYDAAAAQRGYGDLRSRAGLTAAAGELADAAVDIADFPGEEHEIATAARGRDENVIDASERDLADDRGCATAALLHAGDAPVAADLPGDELERSVARTDGGQDDVGRDTGHRDVGRRASLFAAVLKTRDVGHTDAPGNELESAATRAHRGHKHVAAGFGLEAGESDVARGAGLLEALRQAGDLSHGEGWRGGPEQEERGQCEPRDGTWLELELSHGISFCLSARVLSLPRRKPLPGDRRE